MSIKKVEFVKSAPNHKEGPTDNKPEYAFIGRSNVGKSSLINMLASAKGLAKTSSTPGKTQLINYFAVNNEWYLVDLPGYGYSKTPAGTRAGFAQIIEEYAMKRNSLSCMFVLVDIRHNPLSNDLDFIEFLGKKSIPFVIVFTKSDKLTPAKIIANVELYQNELKKTWVELPTIFVTSSIDQKGRDEIINFIDQTNKLWFDAK